MYLLPVSIGGREGQDQLPALVAQTANQLSHFIVENTQRAQRALGALKVFDATENLHFYAAGKKDSDEALHTALKKIEQGTDMGLLSDAGLPGVADPGAEAVRLAHQKNINIIPLAGPSSIFMALAASGLNGQQFRFLGYLPLIPKERNKTLHALAKTSAHSGETQIWIEAPQRNDAMLLAAKTNLPAHCYLTIAVALTTKEGYVKTKTIKQWQQENNKIGKKPTVFLLNAKKH